MLFLRLFDLCFPLLLGGGGGEGVGEGAAVCDFGTPWTFLLPFLHNRNEINA